MQSSKKLQDTLWNILDVGLYPVAYLFFTPFFMHSLGAEMFGLWMFVNTTIVVFLIFNFGLNISTTKNVADAIGLQDYKKLHFIINQNLTLTFLICLVVLIFGFANSLLAIKTNFYKIASSQKVFTSYALFLATWVACTKLIELIFQSIFKGLEDFKTLSIINILTRFTILGSNLLLLYWHQNIGWLLVANIFFASIYLVVFYFVLKHKIPQFQFQFILDYNSIKQELKFSKWIWFQAVAVILAYQGDKFLVATFIDVKEKLGSYSLVSTMFNHIQILFGALVPWLLPQVVKSKTLGLDYKSFYLTVRALVVGLGLVGLTFFYCIYSAIFTLWLGVENYQLVAPYIPLFIVFQMYFLMTIVPYFYLNATGQEKLATWTTFLICGANILGMLIGLELLNDPTGIIWGLIASMAFTLPIQSFFINKYELKQSIFKETFLNYLPMFCFAVFVFSTNGWIKMGSISVAFFCTWFFYFRVKQFNLKLLFKK